MNNFRKHRRVVITGLGIVSPLGRTVDEFWKSLTKPTLREPNAPLPVEQARRPQYGIADFHGRIDDFGDLPDSTRQSIRKALKLMNRETQMGVAAGQQALLDSGFVGDHDPERVGVCFGAENPSVLPEDFLTGIRACSDAEGGFDFDRWGTDGLPEIAPLWLLKCLPNMSACHLAIVNDLRGPNNTITQRDLSANMAIAEACRVIKDGDADAILSGATGTTLHAFNRLHARLENEIADGVGNVVCRPFDKRRCGPAPGEGAGAVVLEELNAALRRGARIYGEVLGAASASFIGHDGAATCGKALTSAMRQSLKLARLSPAALGHVHAHGLGTRESDIAEARAICEALGLAGRDTPLVAAKSHLANAGAGAGAMELVASLLALQHGRLFPVLNYGEPDPECSVRPVTNLCEAAGASFLNLNMFGRGLASCVAVGAFQD